MNLGRTIYLHIGAPKTGSTALQHAGDKNRQSLLTNGVCYPSAPGERNHINLAIYALAEDPAALHRMTRGLPEQQDWQAFQRSFPEELRREIVASGCSKVVLSSEHLSTELRTATNVLRLIALLRTFGQVKVVCYVRPQHEAFLSWQSNWVKLGETKWPPVPGADNVYYNYEIMLRPWADALGDDNIIVRVYDRELLVGGDIVSDFLSVIGCDGVAVPEITGDMNRRLDASTLQFLGLLNAHLPRFEGETLNLERDDVQRALEAISTGPEPTGDPEILTHILKTFEASNAAIAKRFLGRSDGVLFTNVRIPDQPADDEALTVEKAVEIAAHLWRWKTRQVLRSRRRARQLLARVNRLEARAVSGIGSSAQPASAVAK